MTTPAGIWNAPMARLATMLSVVEPFWTFLGVSSSAAALARVYYEGFADPSDNETGQYTPAEYIALRPCAILSAPDRDAWTARRVAEETFITSGQLLITFVKTASGASHGLPTAQDVVAHKNLVGPIIGKSAAGEDDGLLDLPWQSPYLATKELRCIEGPAWGDPELVQDEGVWIASTWLLEW